MKTLLKDMPEFAERIENNVLLKSDINDILSDHSDYYESLSSNVIDTDDFRVVSDAIIDKLTDFINQNYTFKGV